MLINKMNIPVIFFLQSLDLSQQKNNERLRVQVFVMIMIIFISNCPKLKRVGSKIVFSFISTEFVSLMSC